VLARWLGHADVRTTEGYIVAYRGDLQVVSPVQLGQSSPDVAPSAHAVDA